MKNFALCLTAIWKEEFSNEKFCIVPDGNMRRNFVTKNFAFQYSFIIPHNA